MYYEPDTVWGRTIEGDHEVATPKSGLSLVQRRVLQDLAHPRTFAALAAHYRAEAPKLEHELIWLAERRLVAFQRPGAPQPRTAPRLGAPVPALHEPPPWKPSIAVYLFAIGLGIGAVVLVLF